LEVYMILFQEKSFPQLKRKNEKTNSTITIYSTCFFWAV